MTNHQTIVNYQFEWSPKNYIRYRIDGKTLWIENYNIDENDIKAFFVILKSSINELEMLGCQKLRQWVKKHEWEKFLKEKWKLVEEDQEYNLIECEILCAPMLIGDGLMEANKI